MEVEPIALLRQRDEISELSILVEPYFEGFNFGRLKCPFSFAFCSKGPERLHEASRRGHLRGLQQVQERGRRRVRHLQGEQHFL